MLEKHQVIDQSEIMKKIAEIFDSSSKAYKKALIHYYWLYNAIHFRDKSEEWEKFLDKRAVHLTECIHYYVVLIHIFHELYVHTTDGKVPVSLDDFDIIVEKYNASRFHKNELSLPFRTEAALYCAAANLALDAGDNDRNEKYLKTALCEAGGDLRYFQEIVDALENKRHVNIAELLSKDPEKINYDQTGVE